MRIIAVIIVVLSVAGCAQNLSAPAQGATQLAPGTVRPYVGMSMTVEGAVGSGKVK